jgi:hypothetical protein
MARTLIIVVVIVIVFLLLRLLYGPDRGSALLVVY